MIRSLPIIPFLIIAACAPTVGETTGEDVTVAEHTESSAPESSRQNDEVVDEEVRSYAGTVPAPEFPDGLDWLNTEQPLAIADLRGKVVLLDFWTYGCINCMHNFPGLKQLEAEYANELVVVGVHSAKFENEGDTENIRQIILRYDLEHPVINDHEFTVWNTWGARAWPTLVLIDPSGNVVGGHSGEGVYPVFKPVIAALVKEFDEVKILDRTPLELKLEKEGLPSTVLSFPGKVLADPAAGRLFVADTNHHRILQVNIENGQVQAVFGSGVTGLQDGAALEAQFYNPQGMALAGDTLYVADVDNHAIRAIDLVGGTVDTVVGTGSQANRYPPMAGLAPDVELNSPWDLALDGNHLYIAMAGSHQIWQLGLSDGVVEPTAGSGGEGTLNGPRAGAELAQPSGLAFGPNDRLYFADSESSSIRWVELTGNSPEVGTLAGGDQNLFQFGDLDGVGAGALMQHPLGVVSDGELIYVADTYNSKIKRIDPDTGEVTTWLGEDHGWRDGEEPLFYEPGGLDLVEDVLYVADTNNHAVRLVDIKTGETSTLVISGIEAFMPAAADYQGAVLTLKPATVAGGAGTLVIDVQTPEGYKFNDLAPTSVTWSVEGDVADIPDEANVTIPGPTFPMEFEVSFREGGGKLVADLNLYYCKAVAEELCLFDQVRLELPLVVGGELGSVAGLVYEIPKPDSPSN
ncbi:MAG: thioredoxin-like domain-containing protein [Anaerolineales bacterium]